MSRPTTWKELLSKEILPREIGNTIAKSFHTAVSEEQCLDISKAEKSAHFLVKHEGQDNPSFIHSVTTAMGDRTTGYGKKKEFYLCGLGRTAFALKFDTNELFKPVNLKKYAYDELLVVDSTQEMEDVKPLEEATNIPEVIKLRSIQYVPAYLAPHLLSSTATTSAEMALVVKSVMNASLPPTTLDTELDAGKTGLSKNVTFVPENEPAMEGTPAIAEIEQDTTVLNLVDNRPEDLFIDHGGLVLQWCKNFENKELKGTPLVPETSKGIVHSASEELHLSHLADSTIQPPPGPQAPALAGESSFDTKALIASRYEMIRTLGDTFADSISNSSSTNSKPSKNPQANVVSIGNKRW